MCLRQTGMLYNETIDTGEIQVKCLPICKEVLKYCALVNSDLSQCIFTPLFMFCFVIT